MGVIDERQTSDLLRHQLILIGVRVARNNEVGLDAQLSDVCIALVSMRFFHVELIAQAA